MANPFQSPNVIEQASTLIVHWSRRQRFGIALLLTAICTLFGLIVFRLFGVPFLETILENQIWTLLAFTVLAFLTNFGSLNQTGAEILKLCCACCGLIVLVYFVLSAIQNILLGKPFEYFVFWHRIFGEYFWVYWSQVLIFGCVPISFAFARVRRSFKSSFLTLGAIVVCAAFYLRVNYIMKYSETIPSSWSQFFWCP